ncbi:MAG: hypothetical protein H6708_31365 [Kofleriaceae bacterium]|nr:hypothetical protein [Kofleriaceae bacterium]
MLAVVGDAARLPWVDGVAYLGRDLAAPSLLVPTTLAPDAPPALVERALRARLRRRRDRRAGGGGRRRPDRRGGGAGRGASP